MHQIKFRGKIYYSEFEMPANIRQAYQKAKLQEAKSKPQTDIVDLHPDVKEMYEKSRDKPGDSNAFVPQANDLPSTDLPSTDEISRQSAPVNMKHLPSDKSIYQPAPPVVDHEKATVEPESGTVTSQLIYGVLVAIVITALVYFAVQLFR
jgi:hypothetical protein